MISTGPRGADVYTDLNGLAQLKSQARADSPEALKQTARQFEALFLQMAMKNMRQAGEPMESKLFDNSGTRMFRDMQDQQMALHLSKTSSVGFADMLVKQLGHHAKANGKALSGKGLDEYWHNTVRMIPLQKSAKSEGGPEQGKPLQMPQRIGAVKHAVARHESPFADEKAFFQQLLPEATAAAAELGVDPKLLLSQAALETGWGKSVLRRNDGGESHNLFGIKADKHWEGGRIASNTLEYEQGVPVRKTDYFRAYGSYQESFRDYVGFLRNNPRYAQALEKVDNPRQYVAALQQAGYATDPRYASKVLSIYQQWRDFDAGTPPVLAGNASLPADSSMPVDRLGQTVPGQESV